MMIAKPTFKTPFTSDSDCEKCGGLGFVPVPDRDGAMSMCECNARLGYGYRLAVSGIPTKYRSAAFKDLVAETASETATLEAVSDYIANFRQHDNDMYLYGNFGTGKTHLACAVLLNLSKKYATGILYCNVPRMLADRRKIISPDEGEDVDRRIFEKVNTIDVLVLDDLGAENDSGWAIEYLTGIIDARYGALKPTIVTSNVRQDKLYELYGGRLASRLFERCVVGHLNGRDRRKQAVAA